MIDYEEAREELRKWAVKYTAECDIQSGWPCGTCFINLLKEIGLNSRIKKVYEAHNSPVNRTNEVWRAIIQIREARIKKNVRKKM